MLSVEHMFFFYWGKSIALLVQPSSRQQSAVPQDVTGIGSVFFPDRMSDHSPTCVAVLYPTGTRGGKVGSRRVLMYAIKL